MRSGREFEYHEHMIFFHIFLTVFYNRSVSLLSLFFSLTISLALFYMLFLFHLTDLTTE